MNIRKLIALILALSLCLSLFAACAQSEEAPESTDNIITEAPTTEEPSTEPTVSTSTSAFSLTFIPTISEGTSMKI